MKFSMTDGGFQTKTDYGELSVSGEEEYGFRPFQLMTSSIAVCSGGVLRKIMNKRHQTVHDIQIEAEVERDEKQANKITAVHLHFIVKAENVTEAQMQKNMEWTKKNCSMVQSVKDSIAVTETFELLSD